MNTPPARVPQTPLPKTPRAAALEAQRRTLDLCVAGLSRPNLALLLTGSHAAEAADEWSDIDLTAVALDGGLADARSLIHEAVAGAGRVLARFPATHLGLDRLYIFFLETGQQVVKVDVALTAPDEVSPTGGTILHDPSGLLRTLAGGDHPDVRHPPDFGDLHHKFTGWVWYTYTKIVRGELLEAVASLDVMRRLALLPCIQHVLALPQEGFRRLEDRLPPGLYHRLAETFPQAVTKPEAVRALRALIREFDAIQPELATMLPVDPRQADLAGLLRLIPELRDAAPIAGGGSRSGGAG